MASERLNNEFIKNIGVVSIGPVVSSIVAFIAEPWIARYWSPKIFGMGAYYVNLINLLSGLLFLRYNFAIVQSKNRKEASNLLALCILVMLVFLLLLGLLYNSITSIVLRDFPFDRYSLVLFASASAASLSVLFRFWYSGSKKFVVIAVSSVVMTVSTTIMLLLFGLLGKTNESNMVYIRSLGYILASVVLLFPFVKKDLVNTIRNISVKNLVRVAKLYHRFPVYEFWGFLANTFAFSLPIILVTKFWGQEINGFYAKAYNLLYMFLLVLGDSVNRVLHKETADLVNNNEEISSFLYKTNDTIHRLTLLPAVFIILLGPDFFSTFLGYQWVLSGEFARFISIWIVAAILNMAVVPVYGILNLQKQYTTFTLITLVLRASILIVMGSFKADIVLTIAIFSVANFVILYAQTNYILRAAGVNLHQMLKSLLRPALQLVPYILAIVALKSLFEIPSKLLIVLSAGLALPYIYLFYLKGTPILGLLRSKAANPVD